MTYQAIKNAIAAKEAEYDALGEQISLKHTPVHTLSSISCRMGELDREIAKLKRLLGSTS